MHEPATCTHPRAGGGVTGESANYREAGTEWQRAATAQRYREPIGVPARFQQYQVDGDML